MALGWAHLNKDPAGKKKWTDYAICFARFPTPIKAGEELMGSFIYGVMSDFSCAAVCVCLLTWRQ